MKQLQRLLLAIAILLTGTAALAQTPPGGYGSSPAAGQGGGGGGSSAFSALTASANANTGNFSASQPGTFTNVVMNENWLFTNTGGGSCSTANILAQTGSQTVFLTDVMAGCLNVPASPTNGFSNVYGAYALNPSTSTGGFFGWTGAVGYYSQVGCTGGSAANTKCWGANFSTYDIATKPATLFGNEYDITVNNATTTGAGTIYSFRGAGQPTANTFPAIRIQAPASSASFTTGVSFDDGSMASSNGFNAMSFGQQAAGNSQDGQGVQFNAHNGGTAITYNLHLLQDSYMLLGSAATGQVTWITDGSSGSTGNASGWGITLKATAALPVNTLVKIDTANADSVVICTTADTICEGFVAGTSAVYCALGGTHCGIITVPGSKATGILGTGTCSIGNNVIVDTTTNGRVKCTASAISVAGTWIGIALSAQAVVGNTVDILTKFQ